MKRNKKFFGFTIIELLVVVSIILILSAIILANYRAGQKGLALSRAAYKLTQDLRRAQELAMSARDFKGSPSQGGYGIYFKLTEPNHYILFADCDKEKDYDTQQQVLNCYNAYNPVTGASFSYPELLEDIAIEKDVKIRNLFPISNENTLVITFTPPNPDIFFNPDAAIATITLTTDDGRTKNIVINKAGLIEIE